MQTFFFLKRRVTKSPMSYIENNMLRGIYTSATGMIMNQEKLNLIANNLANVNQTSFKSDSAVMKSFPQMLLQRTREDGLAILPIGSFDLAPVVGRLGTGVEFNESYTHFEQGSIKKTDNPLDLMIVDAAALTEKGAQQKHPYFFVVKTDNGELLTRNGALTLDKNGTLITQDGYAVQGENGSIQLSHHNFIIHENGEVWINGDVANSDGASPTSNDWQNPILLDNLKIRSVDFPRHLEKVGNGLYRPTLESGPLTLENKSKQTNPFQILQRHLEGSNVNLVEQMVEMIATQRNYEANQKSIVSHDQLLGKLINEVGRA